MKAIDELRNEICILRNHNNIDTHELVRIVDAIERELGEEYVSLPKDADGVPIHIGDEMEGVDKYDSLKKVMGKVITVSFESDGIVDVAIQVWNSDGKSWHRVYLDTNASVYRHYHEPTVEDVLWELLGSIRPEMEDDEAVPIVRGFAERLQLKEED